MIERPQKANRRSFDTWDTFNSMAQAGLSLPLLFTPQLVELGSELSRIITGNSNLKPSRDDHRFEDPTWQENPIYKASMQTYLAWCNQLKETVNHSHLDDRSKTQAKVAIKLLTQSLSPTHPANNIDTVKRVVKARGASLVHGLNRMTSDVLQQEEKTPQKDLGSIKLGENIAATPGAVIFRSELLEVIQYQPITAEVHKEPIFIIPSPVNKFYITDLYQHNSLTHYLLDKGFQVFSVSWCNPKIEHSKCGLEEYIQTLIEASDSVRAINRHNKLNLFGFSAGGIFASILASIFKQKGNIEINTASFAVTNFYTHTESQIGTLLNHQMISASKTILKLKGVIDGKELNSLFAWLRPNSLLWNAWVCNYFTGEEQPSADVRFWNNDVPNITSALYCDFLDFYQENPLLEAGQLKLCGTNIDLSEVDCDKFIIAGSSDHITPWECCYQSSLFLGDNREFVLVNRGHRRSIVCPEGSKKARYYTNKTPYESYDDWLSNATQHHGSWWSHWIDWLKDRSAGTKKAPATLGCTEYPVVEKAPGRYLLDQLTNHATN